MPAKARKAIVDPKLPGYYLVNQRVVRGLRLTGIEPATGQDYTYRQLKLEQRVRDLAGLYLIEVAEFSCGADGFELLVRTRPDLLSTLSDEEIVRRMLRRTEKRLELKPPPSDEAVSNIIADPKRLSKLRQRIVNLSQFMGDIDEAMARDVNRESGGAQRDVALGRLWQGRFNSVRVLDPPALLLAATYVESKKVIDGEATTLEEAACCSTALRGAAIATREEQVSGESRGSPTIEQSDGASEPGANQSGAKSARARDAWLLPMSGDNSAAADSASRPEFETDGYLRIEYGAFGKLLRWTLEQAKVPPETRAKRVSDELLPLFSRFQLRVEVWVEAVLNFRRWFRTAIGLGDALKSCADRLGVAWLAGQGRRRHPFTA